MLRSHNPIIVGDVPYINASWVGARRAGAGGCLWAAAVAGLSVACGAGEEAEPEQDSMAAPAPPLAPGIGSEAAEPPPQPPGDLCDVVQAPAILRPGPIDIVVVLDNSGSMGEELAGVERNINENFAAILEQEAVDYRVILLSKHRTPDATRGGVESTAVCVSQPLSSVAKCPSAQPGTSERFFHYSLEIGSNDSLSRILSSYSAPDGDFGLTDAGWSVWLRNRSKKVFLVVSDDDAAMPAEQFVDQLEALAPDQFGGSGEVPGFVFHSIIGLREKFNPSEAYLPNEPRTALRCRSESARVINPGLEYQRLSQLTGGLRFPLCQIDLYNTVFSYIAGDLLSRSGIDCSFDVPAPPAGRVLELDNVEVAYQLNAGGEPITLRQARTPAECGADAFRISDGQVLLCPQACSSVNAGDGAQPEVSVRFTCDEAFVLR